MSIEINRFCALQLDRYLFIVYLIYYIIITREYIITIVTQRFFVHEPPHDWCLVLKSLSIIKLFLIVLKYFEKL